MDTITGINFTRPESLALLLVLIPLAVYMARASMALLRRGARHLSLVLRLAIILLLVLSLSDVSLIHSADRLSVVFLLDRSDSVSADNRALQAQYVSQSIAGMKSNDSAGVVVFGSDALVDRPVLPDKTPPDLASAPASIYTNMADALRLGLAVAPADTARRLVLLSDGRENAGSAELAARLAAAHGIPVDVVPLSSKLGPEVWLDSLKAPSPVREGERVSLQMSISSSTDTTATLMLSMDGTALLSQPIGLIKGTNTFVQNLPPAVKGFHSYTSQIVPSQLADTRSENNRYSAYSLVLGKPSLLIVEGHPGEATALKGALQPSIDADVLPADSMPADVKGLAGYDGIVLVNVPVPSLPTKSMDSLQVVVRDLGKGLIVVGGDESYAAGGYFRTPLEAMLPVALNLPSKLDIPSVGMAIVIDRSGSMEASHDMGGVGVKKIELAKEAASQAVSQLSEKDYVGVITFDSAANWVIEMQPLGDPTQLTKRIGSITSGGGTDIYAGLSPAVDALIASKAKSKHIILLTDGQSEGGDYDGLLKKMSENGVTLSTVAVGSDSDINLMRSLAERGKGRYYYTEDGNALPKIFAHESHIASRSYLIEHPFTPERTAPSAILEGLGGLPPIQGYIGTSPRPGGQIALVSDAGDPLLAQWQYGLGRVVAWTSDAKGQWAKDWIGWQSFPRFWSQAVRWSTGAESASTLQPHVELESGTAHVTVDATAPDGAFLNDLSTQAVIVAPGLVTSTVALHQTSAGRYEGQFRTEEEGAYIMQVQASGRSVGAMRQTVGIVVPYSPEYRGGQTDQGLLARLASLTGGRVLSPDNLGAPFEHNLSAVQSSNELWPVLLLLAILLLPFDIGVRRLGIGWRDIARARAALRKRLGWQPTPLPAAAHASTPGMSALFSAKERTHERTQLEPVANLQDADPTSPSWVQELQLTGRSGRAQSPPPAIQENNTPTGPESKQDAPSSEEGLATRLRRAREQRQ